jgi:O-antigen/teichoic acid export membrane protein
VQNLNLSHILNSDLNRLGKELLQVGVGQAVAAVGSIVGVRLMTGALSPEDYGLIALAITFVTLITQILIGPLSVSLTRYYNFALEKNELPGFFGSSRALAVKISLATVLIFAAGGVYLWLSGQANYLVLAVFTLAFALVSGINVLLDSLQTAARQRAVVAWHQGMGQWLRYLAAVALILLLGKDPGTAMAGYALAACLILGSQTYFFNKKLSAISAVRSNPDPEWNERILKYALPFASWGIFTWLQLTSDRWALQTFASTQDVGLYTVLYQLGYYPLMMASNVFAQFAEPVLFRQAGDGTQADRIARAQRNTRRILMGAFLLVAVAVAAAAVLHPLIFQWFAAPDYRSVSGLLPVMVLSSGLFACGQIASMTQLNRGQSKTLIWPKITTGIAGTIFNFVGAAWMGLPGVVYAGAVFSILYLFWVYLLHRLHSQ